MKKILGIVLLLAGLAVILYGLYSSYNIFTAKSSAPDVFKIVKKESSAPAKTGIEAQAQKLIEEQLRGLLPADSMPQLLNLISWSIFAGILMLGGGQISGLGIKLLR